MQLRSYKIKYRLILFFSLIISLSISLTGLISYIYSKNALEEKVRTYYTHFITDLSNDIYNSTNDDILDFSIALHSESFQKSYQLYERLGEKHYLKQALEEIVDRNLYNSQVSDIRIITNKNDSAYYTRKYLLLPKEMKDIIETPDQTEYAKLVELESGRIGVAFVGNIISIYTYQVIGRYIYTIDELDIRSVYEKNQIEDESSIFIVNHEGVVVSSEANAFEVGEEVEVGVIKKLIQSNHKSGYSRETVINGQLSMIVYHKIDNSDWYIISAIPYSYIYRDIKKTGLSILVVGILCIILSLLFSSIISRSIHLPLTDILEKMNSVKKGDMNRYAIIDGNDEIAEVAMNYNLMLHEINELLVRVKDEEKIRADETIKRLQAQINPHFLTNTLNTIKWLADMQDAFNISELVDPLIGMLRVNMKDSSDFITIEEEILYIENYNRIQQYRYMDKYEIVYNIPDKVLTCKIPKVILQPIVENAIIHGIGHMNGYGQVTISAIVEKYTILLKVRDNGVGFRNYKDSLCTHNENSNKTSGMGMKNVDDRLKLLFGQEYGLEIHSEEDVGTEVTVCIPFTKE